MSVRNPVSPKLAAASNIPNDNSRSKAAHYESLGNSYQLGGRFHQARRFYERWFYLTKDCHAALRLGDVCRQIEDFKSALSWYSVGAKLSQKSHFLQEGIDAKMGTAMCLRGLGKFSSAILQLKRCFLTYKKTKDREGMAYALWALGTTQRFAKQFIAAEKNLRKSIQIYLTLRDPSGLAYARSGLGGTLRMRGKPKASFLLYREAHRYFKRTGDCFGEAYSSCGQGNAWRMQGRSDLALPFMNKAIQIYRSLKLRGPLGFVLWSRSQAMLQLGRMKNSQRDLSDARRQFKLVGDKRGLGYCDMADRQLRLQKNPCKIIQIP